MAGVVTKLLSALKTCGIDPEVTGMILSGRDTVNDASPKAVRAAFMIRAMDILDREVDYATRIALRDECACCTGGWREKAVRRVASETRGMDPETVVERLRAITHLGAPVLEPGGTILAGIGGPGGCQCACALFNGAGGTQPEAPVSKTYCLCCAGHFRRLYQIAFDRPVQTLEVVCSALDSGGREPCRFRYRVEAGVSA